MENGNKTANTKQTVAGARATVGAGSEAVRPGHSSDHPHIWARDTARASSPPAQCQIDRKKQQQQQQRTRAAWSRAITNAATATVRAPAFLVASDLRDVKCSAQEIEVATRRV